MVFLDVMTDEHFMKRALQLARRAGGRTSPNPMVGAVLVKKGEVIEEDYHRRAGTPHAEALVLTRAGRKSRGATLYVTLEPCSHKDKRTPPCSDAIIQTGIRKVVVAMEDPNPRVSGRGMRRLSRAGIQVSVGVLQQEARNLNEAYIKYITAGIPFVTLKTAMTLDGKIATPLGQSKWITGKKARTLVHRTRSNVDAVITAIGTVKADNPELTARVRGGRNPKRVVIDPNLDISDDARILEQPPETILVTRVRGAKAARFSQSGLRMLFFEGSLSLAWLLKELADLEVMSVLIEGGASLNGHAFRESVVDRVMVFISPKIIGGRQSVPAVGGGFFRSLEHACRVEGARVRHVGEDILVEGRVLCPKQAR
jgi:diaminohydroxyphosphoribosylaminopyrimidine deaminase/5-amino-6-(5-phosphoribosylamino)uracil reductase